MKNPPVAAPPDRDPREMWAESEVEWHGPEMLRDFKFWWLTAYGTGAAFFVYHLALGLLLAVGSIVFGQFTPTNLALGALTVTMLALIQLLVSGLVCFLLALPIVCFGGWLIGIRRVSVGAAAFAGGLAGLSGTSSLSMISSMTGHFSLIIMFASFGLAILVGQIGAGWAVAARHPALRDHRESGPVKLRFGVRQLFGLMTLTALVFMLLALFERLLGIPAGASLFAFGLWAVFQIMFLYLGWKFRQMRQSRREAAGR